MPYKTISVEVEVEVEVEDNIEEITTEELVNEMCNRIKRDKRFWVNALTKDMKNKLFNALQLRDEQTNEAIKINSIDDELRFEHLSKIFYKYSLSYLQKNLPE